jgi:hypothetical protein
MIPDLKPDTRTRIEIQLRIHDSVNLVVARLLENRGFHSYDSALARGVEKHTTPVTLHWLTEYLREHFVFIQNGEARELPLSLAKCILARWNEFPEYRYEPSNPTRRRHAKGRSFQTVNK